MAYDTITERKIEAAVQIVTLAISRDKLKQACNTVVSSDVNHFIVRVKGSTEETYKDIEVSGRMAEAIKAAMKQDLELTESQLKEMVNSL